MKLASFDNRAPDGRLRTVSADTTRAAPARAATTLRDALDRWGPPSSLSPFALTPDELGPAWRTGG